MVGTRITHYEITAKLGEGGMGVVYRARDTKLGRDVALKVLPEQFACDPQRMGRFSREAHVLASLNHPNIAGIHGLEEQNGVYALVTELVEGPTLADRIAEGPMPLDEAMPLARQMAEALEYAHEHGVIHRDLKPANVKVTEEGTVKVLDFGLAKAMEDEAATGDPADSPTLTLGATKAGVILGTAAYMAPEQARGKRVDKRADIWAFGVVLYEMLTGKRLFRGEDLTETLASVVKEQPDLSAAPPKVRRLLAACLQKDPRQRLQAIGDMRLLLEEAPTAQAPAMRSWLWPPVAGFFAVAFLVLAFVYFRQTPAEAPAEAPFRKFTVTPPVAVAVFSRSDGRALSISPDGRHVAFVEEGSEGRLWVRDLDQEQPRVIEGTEGAFWPFWSPDSAFIGFVVNGGLRKVSVQGGSSNPICELPGATFRGGTWSPDGEVIIFSAAPPLPLPSTKSRQPEVLPSR